MYKYFILLIIILILIISKYNNLLLKENFSNKLIIKKPTYWKQLNFTNKLKIYGSQINKDYSLFVDKLNVKTYINNLGIKDLYIAKLYTILESKIDVLNLNSLPKNCVIKTNHGWADIIIVKDNKIKQMYARGTKMEPEINNYKLWKKIVLKKYKTKYEPHYQYLTPTIFVEEYLGDNLIDYKIFCINSKPVLLQTERDVKKENCINFYDNKFNKLNIHKNYKKCNYIISKPKKCDKLLSLASKISKKFEFVRTDFYIIKDKIYFGEFTFIPSGGNSYFNPISFDYKLSKNWD